MECTSLFRLAMTCPTSLFGYVLLDDLIILPHAGDTSAGGCDVHDAPRRRPDSS